LWTEAVDLHSHTTYSDGVASVRVMAERAAKNGVKVWSLTDHDTAAGWDEAREEANRLGMRFIPGVEITCEVPLLPEENMLDAHQSNPSSWHLLAYFPEGCSHGFVEWLDAMKEARIPRMEGMIQRLSEHGMEISLEEVMAIADGAVGRPHLARVMLEKGMIDTFQEAFDLWIGDEGPAFSPRPLPKIPDVVNKIRSENGISSLAHPYYYGISPKNLGNYLISQKIDAVEAFHRSHSDSLRWALMNIGLPITVGGDSHGTEHNPSPGKMLAPLTHLHSAFHP